MRKHKRLAVAIITFNEQNDIEDCIASLKNLKSEIYVFDSQSTDKTRELSLKMNAKVVDFVWNGEYPKKKQWVLDYLKHDYSWVLLLDADERISKELAQEILNVTNNNSKISAYDAKIEYWFCGTLLKHGLKVKKRVLVRPDKVMFPEIDDLQVRNMWEVEGHYQPRVIDGTIGGLSNSVEHQDSDSLFDYFLRHNKYSDWEAIVMSNPRSRDEILSLRPRRVRLFWKLPARGAFLFLYSYIIKGGFLDGRAGFDFAAHQAFYYWQIRVKSLSYAAHD